MQIQTKSRISPFYFIILISFWSLNLFAQPGTWTKSETPRFRNANAVWMLSSSKLVAVGGWLTNDSLTGIYTSQDSGKNWDFKSDNFGGQLNDVWFTNGSNGYACGKYGRFFKTTDAGQNWTNADLSAYLNTDLKSLAFTGSDTCWMVGGGAVGNRSLILFSTNKGSTWTKQLDSTNGKLLSVFVVNKNTVWACGSNGLLYKTTDAGSTWTRIYLPSKALQNNMQSVFFTDANNGFVAGGAPSNDSLQLIYGTTNGGAVWQTLRDTLMPRLNCITFVSKTEGYAAGNSGVVLYTENSGTNWNPVNISNVVNDNRNIQDAFFYNKYAGIMGSSAGKILHYYNKTAQLPKVKLNRIVITPDNKVNFIGSVNPEGISAQVVLKYSTDLSFNQSATVGTYTGSNTLPLITSLVLPKNYYNAKYVVTSAAGTSESEILTVYTGKSEVPNFDFEAWDTTYTESVKSWEENGVVNRYKLSGNKMGIQVRCKPNADGPGALLLGYASDNGLEGGIPYAGKPTSISLRCRYKAAIGDSVGLFYNFKYKGKTVASKLNVWGGTVLSKDTTIIWPVNINDTAKVDTLILAIISTNVFGGKIDTASYIIADSIWFSGTTATIPNQGFNQWDTIVSNHLVFWNDYQSRWNSVQSVFRSNTAYQGKYSAHLGGNSGAKGYPGISTSPIGQGPTKPSFAISGKYSKLNFFVRFNPKAQGDSFIVRGNFFKNGQGVAYVQYFQTSTDIAFKPVSVPISYNNSTIPDSGVLDISIYNGSRQLNYSGAEAWIDQITFDNWVDTFNTAKTKSFEFNNQIKFFPNPASQFVTIQSQIELNNAKLFIYSREGKLLIQKILNGSSNQIDLSKISNGMYFITIENQNQKQTKSILIQR